MENNNKNTVIVKESLRTNSLFNTVLNCVIMFGLFVFTFASIVFFIIALRFPEYDDVTVIMAVLFFGGIFTYRVVGLIKGRVYAIISDEGIAVRGSLFSNNQLKDVIPWESVREIRGVYTLRGFCVGIKYIGNDNKKYHAKIQHRFTNYSYNQVYKIVNAFRERNKC